MVETSVQDSYHVMSHQKCHGKESWNNDCTRIIVPWKDSFDCHQRNYLSVVTHLFNTALRKIITITPVCARMGIKVTWFIAVLTFLPFRKLYTISNLTPLPPNTKTHSICNWSGSYHIICSSYLSANLHILIAVYLHRN